jgi:NADH pyrophosphatase NudC (nudix superfamily)
MDDWKFCPRCGSKGALEGSGDNPFFQCSACGYTKYDNPLPTTIGLIERGDQVLLVQRGREPQRGEWDAVGGFLTPGETAEQCMRREALEEIACELQGLRPLGTFASTYGTTGLQTIGIAFICSIKPDAEITLSDENTNWNWFSYHLLPEVAFADVREALLQRASQLHD